MKDRITIAVSGLGPMQPGLPCIRAIRAAGKAAGIQIRVVGLSYDPLEPANYEPELLDRTVLMTYPTSGSQHVYDRLVEVHHEDPIDVILPTLDSELNVLLKLEPRLRELGIAMLLPTEDCLALRSKAKLPELCKSAGIRTPETRAAYSIEGARAAAQELGWPVMVKGQFYEARRAWNQPQFEAALNHMVTGWGLPVVIQQVIEGTEFDAILLGGREGELLGAVPMKKLQLDEQGKAWGGVTIADPRLDKLVSRAMKGLKWRGMCELEMIKNSKDGEYYVIEVNPRVPAWVQLAVVAGQNMPWATIQLALDETLVPFTTYAAGTMTLRQCFDLTAPMGAFERLVIAGQVDHSELAGHFQTRPFPTPGAR